MTGRPPSCRPSRSEGVGGRRQPRASRAVPVPPCPGGGGAGHGRPGPAARIGASTDAVPGAMLGRTRRKVRPMSETPPPAGPVDLEALDRFLMSDASPEDCMQLSDLDGFLTGIAIGPELVLPSEWLPAVWGGEGPGFDDAEQARTVLGAIMGRYNEILRLLAADPDAYAPLFWEGPEGEVIAADWAEGFADAVRFRPEAWRPLLEDREACVMLMPILALCGDAEGGSPLELDPETDADLLAEAPDLIPACVVGIAAFWKDRRGRPTKGAGRARRPKVGRNDPCPCGSGRKYKRCCGAH